MNAPAHLLRPDDFRLVFCGAQPPYYIGGITWRAYSSPARVTCRRCLTVRAAERRETAAALSRSAQRTPRRRRKNRRAR